MYLHANASSQHNCLSAGDNSKQIVWGSQSHLVGVADMTGGWNLIYDSVLFTRTWPGTYLTSVGHTNTIDCWSRLFFSSQKISFCPTFIPLTNHWGLECMQAWGTSLRQYSFKNKSNIFTLKHKCCGNFQPPNSFKYWVFRFNVCSFSYLPCFIQVCINVWQFWGRQSFKIDALRCWTVVLW